MSSVKTKKDRYDCHRKEICDNKDNYKPRHTHALIICMLEEIIEKMNNCKCGKEECEDEVIEGDVTQNGVVNVNADVNSIIKKAKK